MAALDTELDNAFNLRVVQAAADGARAADAPLHNKETHKFFLITILNGNYGFSQLTVW